VSEEKEPTEVVAPDVEEKPQYVFHQGSIRVSGKSQVFRTGLSAFHEWRKGTRPVEFVFLGGNAGHQAYKASVVTKREIESVCKTKIAFLPMWSTVMTDSADGRPGELKDVSLWRIEELKYAQKKNFKPRKPKNKPESVKSVADAQSFSGGTLTKQKLSTTLEAALKSGPIKEKGEQE